MTHSDYTSKSNTPALARHLSKKAASHIRSSLSIPEVLGDVELGHWQSTIVKTCNAHLTSLDASSGTIPTTLSPTPHIISITFPPLHPSTRAEDLIKNDQYLASLLDLLPSSNYTVLYTTSTIPSKSTSPSGKETEYTMDATELEKTLHMDLKRNLNTHKFAKRANITLPEGGLFERYQFFTPGKPTPSLMLVTKTKTNTSLRNLHGFPGRVHPPANSLRRHLRPCQSPGVLRSF